MFKDALVLTGYAVGMGTGVITIGTQLVGMAADQEVVEETVIIEDTQDIEESDTTYYVYTEDDYTSVSYLLSDIEPHLTEGMTECPTEDFVPSSGACYWDAKQNGNGEGTSFISLADGSIIYFE